MTDLLADDITNDQQWPNSETGEHVLPSLLDNAVASALINFRLLVSSKEAGCLIGQSGAVIDSIRAETNTRAGMSKIVPGTYERILTVSGTLDDTAKAISYFAQALVNASAESNFSYSHFPLKQLLAIPNIDGETTALRLLIPNAQMGTLFGSRGVRIQQIQKECNVLMIASKSFLPESNERLVEIQGTVDNLYDALRIILRCLIEDFSSSVGTTHYVPKASNSRTSTNNSKRSITHTMAFSNDIVGALIGKNGARIQGVRKVSGAFIGISDEEDELDNRTFTITGPPKAVEKAETLLRLNLEREQQRRQQADAQLDLQGDV